MILKIIGWYFQPYFYIICPSKFLIQTVNDFKFENKILNIQNFKTHKFLNILSILILSILLYTKYNLLAPLIAINLSSLYYILEGILFRFLKFVKNRRMFNKIRNFSYYKIKDVDKYYFRFAIKRYG